MSSDGIGVVGAGVAGLHLALYLQAHDVPVILYTESTADEIRAKRLLNTLITWHPVRDRERALGVHHWDDLAVPGTDEPFGAHAIRWFVGDPAEPMAFTSHLASPAICLDQRIVTAALLEDFADRKGAVVVGPVSAGDVVDLTETHDLVVITAGRGSLTELWAPMPERCTYTEPQRRLTAAMVAGVEPHPGPQSISLANVPGVGEIIDMPTWTFDGSRTALLFEMVPGGAGGELAANPYRYDDPAPFEQTMLRVVERFSPQLFARIDPGTFRVNRPGDVLSGSITPTVRRPWTTLANGRRVMAIGDQHAVNDPLCGQGAGAASAAAFIMGQAITEAGAVYDEAFCAATADRLWAAVEPACRFNNLFLGEPVAPNVLEVVLAAAASQAVADEIITWWPDPAAGWEVLATPERTRDHLRAKGLATPVLDGVLAGGPAAS